MKMKVDETEYDIDFATIDLDGHCTLRAILGKPLREAWQEVDWDDQKAAASFLNDPLVIKALTWLAMWQGGPSVAGAEGGRDGGPLGGGWAGGPPVVQGDRVRARPG